tara:strand:- start:25 stop:1347 length:1323 start_codon:yes stop_codon:yes gene_type:complete
MEKFLNNKNLIQFFLFLIPISFFLGNTAINITITAIIISGLFLNWKNISQFQNRSTLVIFFFFFGLLIFSTFLSNLHEGLFQKSLIFSRYFLLIIILGFFVNQHKVDYNIFFLICLSATIFLSIDIIYQYIFKKDIFGFVIIDPYHYNGFFKDDRVAGSYIQRFLCVGITFFLIAKDTRNNKIALTICLILGLVAAILAGNRIPLLNLILFLFIILIFFKNFRMQILSAFVVVLLFFSFLLNTNNQMKTYYTSLYFNSKGIFLSVEKEVYKKYPQLDYKKNLSFEESNFVSNYDKEKDKNYNLIAIGSGHIPVFISAIETISISPFTGSGLKSFRYTCLTRLHLPNRICQSHPHNYFLEILNDVGILGFIIFFTAVILILKNIYDQRKEFSQELIIRSVFALTLLVEIFPIKSTGSFFTTSNAAFIFILIGLIIQKKNKI